MIPTAPFWCTFTPFCDPGLAVGLDPQGYGNPDFCWLSVHDTLIWSFAGPIVIVVVVSMVELTCGAVSCCYLFCDVLSNSSHNTKQLHSSHLKPMYSSSLLLLKQIRHELSSWKSEGCLPGQRLLVEQWLYDHKPIIIFHLLCSMFEGLVNDLIK